MEDTTREVGIQLRELNRTLRSLKQQRATGGSGVPASLVSVLMYIDEQVAGCHGRTLAARAGLDPSTVSRAVAALVGQGLVERHADPVDGRASVLVVTAAGRAALDDTHRWFGDLLDRALAGWAPDDIASLCAALSRFARDIGRTLVNHPSYDTTLEAAQ